MFVKTSERYVVTSHRNRAPNSNALTDTRRMIGKIEYYPRNVPPQNPSFERGGKKDIELSYDFPPMGRQEQSFDRSRTTLTTVVRIAVSKSIGAPVACRSAGLQDQHHTVYADIQALSSFLYPYPLSTPLVLLSTTLSPSTVAHPLSLPYSLQVSPS